MERQRIGEAAEHAAVARMKALTRTVNDGDG